jgi:tetratricopeptide (TPR) repeat protein
MPAAVVPGYRTAELLGAGGFGQVFAGRRQRDDLAVAIKIAHPHLPAAWLRLEREAEALALVGAPTVPALLESGRLDSGVPYIVMERLFLCTLGQRMDELLAPMPREELQARIEPLLGALEMVHRRGLVHRDLKPENIFSSDQPAQARLCDFGIVKGSALSAAQNATVPEQVLGTYDYMAPEQCEAAAGVDVRADLYSLGAILYELLTGRPPFVGAAADIRHGHLFLRPRPPSELGSTLPALDPIVLRLLAKDPSARFSTTGGLVGPLLRAMAARQSTAVADLQSPAPPTSAHPRRRVLAGLVFLETADLPAVLAELPHLGGEVAAIVGQRLALAFTEIPGETPLAAALRAGRLLLDRQICSRVIVHLDFVEVSAMTTGKRTYRSPVLVREASYPGRGDPPGLTLTREAAAAQPQTPAAAAAPVGLARAAAVPAGASEPTPIDSGYFARTAELRAIGRAAEEVVTTRKPVWLTVIGETGMGKTRLCGTAALALRAAPSELLLLELRGSERERNAGPTTLEALFRWALAAPPEPPADLGRRFCVERLGEPGETLWPVVALNLGWMGLDDPALAALREAPRALQTAAVRAALEAMRRCAERPLAVLLDDAHLADAETLEALEKLTFAEPRWPVAVIAFARPTLLVARPQLARAAPGLGRIELAPLDADQAALLAADLLRPAENIPRRALARLYERTGGSPLLLVELIRAIQREGLVRRHPEGRHWYLATDELERLPDAALIQWLAGRELGELPPMLAAHARLCALLGSVFSGTELEGVMQELEREGLGVQFPLDARAGARRLVGLGVLVTQRDDRLRFRHAALRDATAESMPESLRRRAHAAIARYYEQARALPELERLAKLAHHAERSELPAQAAAAYLELADRLRRRHVYLEAEAAYSRSLGLLVASARGARLQALRGRGLMRFRVGRCEDALDDFTAARALARELSLGQAEAEIVLDQAMTLDWMSQHHRSRELVEEATRLAGAHPSPLVDARLLMSRGRATMRFEDAPGALALLGAAAAKAEQLGEVGYETLVIALLILPIALTALGRGNEAEETFARVIELCRAHGDAMHLGAALYNRALILFAERADAERVIGDLQHAVDAARELGITETVFVRMVALAEAYLYLGELERAQECITAALAHEQGVHKTPQPAGLVTRARILFRRGEPAAARATLMPLLAGGGGAAEAATPLLPDEAQLTAMLDLATRGAAEAEWEALETQARAVSHGVFLELLQTRALALAAVGDDEGARFQLGRALAAVRKRPHLIARSLERLRQQLGPSPPPAGS